MGDMGWDELPLEVKLKILSLLPVAGESGGVHHHEAEEEGVWSGVGRPRSFFFFFEEVCREWCVLLWHERRHLDLSLRAMLRDVSNEGPSLKRLLSRCKRLETLVLSHCPVGDDVLSAFVPLRASLRLLVLSSCPQITNEALLRLASTGGMSQLERLDLGGCVRVTGQGVVDFLAHCPLLQDLNISGVWGFGNAHMKAVAESAPRLKRINLSGTAISSVGLRYLLTSGCAAQLESISLSGCAYLTSTCINELGACCPSLVGWTVTHTTVGD